MDDSHTFFWLVGICEGEAYFGYRQKGQIPIIEVEMKDEHVIARIAALMGVQYTRRDRTQGRVELSVTYRVTISGRRALQVMKRIQPYLSPRRARTIQKIEDSYLAHHGDRPHYARFPLPPLVDVPYTVARK